MVGNYDHCLELVLMLPPLQPNRGGIERLQSGLAADEIRTIVGNHGPWS